ncbi:Pirin cupin [Gracilaria domingensis]|nr:Pirin cupin [Gracilaria domingensis]
MHPKSQLVLNPETQRAFVYVYRGSATIGHSMHVEEGQFAVLGEDAHLPIVIRSEGVDTEQESVPHRDWCDFDTFVDNGCWCIVLAGDPIMEPVSMLSSGIVACTPQETRKAFQEYRCGSLGSCSPSTIQRTHLDSALDDIYDSASEKDSDAFDSDAHHDLEFALEKPVA